MLIYLLTDTITTAAIKITNITIRTFTLAEIPGVTSITLLFSSSICSLFAVRFVFTCAKNFLRFFFSSISFFFLLFYFFYFSLHSNASGDGFTEGRQRGIIAFYYPTSANGRRAANIFVENLKEIYPLPSLVTARATTALGEVRQPKPPSVLLEIGYHDNTADAVWIQDNVQNIAENLSRSLAEYFALPFIYPMTPRTGTVVTERDALNVRAYPAMSGQVVGSVPHEAQLTVYGQTDGWYSMG